MLFRVDPSSSQPLFEQLAAQVRMAVLSGDLPDGERLPAAREVGEALQVNQHTVLHAYQSLRDEGLIELRRGRGAVVTASSSERYQGLAQSLEAVRAEARRLGLPLSAVARMIDQPAEGAT
ncbi:GntR family transcriptional regulator [Nesterenkonia halotolerans]|uniref:GntR family transcriptional regulator n=1 Tax=Nesterenkonia halotolerans TaxID=225325 RepID=A0ABR9J3Z1_9MICC|nr:GntR family transcriptional regulator [Nesterenkonia halotolerans]MBE1513728.1 GntR family transcriptional regulator [Nesterenkonia halotolerans]